MTFDVWAFSFADQVYNPWLMLAVKLLPIVVLRAGKILALVLNEAVGHLFLRWHPGESHVLDFVGRGTAAICHELYGEEVDEPLVRAFLVRRLLFCALTSAATAMQITLQLTGSPQYGAALTLLLAPVTLVDRQLATLVTKMAPRYDRSLLCQFLRSLASALRGPFPDLPNPARLRAAGSRYPLCNLTVLEMVVGVVQFGIGLVLTLYTVLLLADHTLDGGTTEGRHARQLPRYFDTGEGRCELGALCFETVPCIITLRCVKEACNWLSPCIEWRLTRSKYSAMQDMANASITAMVQHMGGVDQLATNLRTSPSTHAACAALIVRCLLQGGEQHGRSSERGGELGDGAQSPDSCWRTDSCIRKRLHTCEEGGLPLLPMFLRGVALNQVACACVCVTCVVRIWRVYTYSIYICIGLDLLGFLFVGILVCWTRVWNSSS